MKKSKLDAITIHLNQREIKAQKASRDSIKYKQCEYLADKIGKVYKGVVTSIMDFGLFIEMPSIGSEGLVRLVDISDDTWVSDVDNHCIKGFNTGEVIRLGDEVTIIIKSVDIERKNVDLSLIRL